MAGLGSELLFIAVESNQIVLELLGVCEQTPNANKHQMFQGFREVSMIIFLDNVGLSGRKNDLRKLLRIPYRLRLFVSFFESSD